MTGPTPCYRHSRGVWLAACPDCTAWHLSRLGVRRSDAGSILPHSGPAPTGPSEPTLRLVA